jgi:DNA-binding transcriptional LysR family regulator
MTPQDSHYPGGEQISPLVWRADSFYVMAELVIRGVGWAWLPRHVAQYPTYQGHLQELRSDWAPLPLVVELVCRRDGALGPAANWLADCLARELLRPQA